MASAAARHSHADVAQEIVDCILDSVFPFDKATLLTCALISRTWCNAARRITFRVVHCHEKIRKLQEFRELLSSPLQTVSRHIREFSIADALIRPATRKPMGATELRELLGKMHQLRKLSLASMDIVSDEDRVGDSALPFINAEELSVERCRFRRSNGAINMIAFASLLTMFSEINTLALTDPDTCGQNTYVKEPTDGAAPVPFPDLPSNFSKVRVGKVSLKFELSEFVTRILGQCLREGDVDILRLKWFKASHSIVGSLRSHVRCLRLSEPFDISESGMSRHVMCWSLNLIRL